MLPAFRWSLASHGIALTSCCSSIHCGTFSDFTEGRFLMGNVQLVQPNCVYGDDDAWLAALFCTIIPSSSSQWSLNTRRRPQTGETRRSTPKPRFHCPRKSHSHPLNLALL